MFAQILVAFSITMFFSAVMADEPPPKKQKTAGKFVNCRCAIVCQTIFCNAIDCL